MKISQEHDSPLFTQLSTKLVTEGFQRCYQTRIDSTQTFTQSSLTVFIDLNGTMHRRNLEPEPSFLFSEDCSSPWPSARREHPPFVRIAVESTTLKDIMKRKQEERNKLATATGSSGYTTEQKFMMSQFVEKEKMKEIKEKEDNLNEATGRNKFEQY